MSALFEELDRQQTPMGEISLRRRVEPTLKVDVYEVKLGDEYLMSSLFTASETRLAEIALAVLDGEHLDVVVGGLGLGYTAAAILDDRRVRRLDVIEALPEVLDWHRRHLLPVARRLTDDARCHLVEADFFAVVANDARFHTGALDHVHAIVVDIDHTPRHHLHPSHAAFYTTRGLHRVCERLHPDSVFALWSDEPPDAAFMATAADVFASCEPHVVTFANPLTDIPASNTVYLCRTPASKRMLPGESITS